METVIEDYIKSLESSKDLDPSCKMCLEIFYPAIREGKRITDIFAPRHRAMKTCRSGSVPHCTCDTCF